MSNSTVTLGVGNLRHVTTRTTASGVVAAVVMALMPARESTVSPAVRLSADSTALIMGGTTIPTPDDYYVGVVKNQYIAPTHPNQNIDYVAVTTPEETWPITGIKRLLWLATGPAEIWGPGGAAWPDEPWWKLSGLFDLTFDQSVQAGVADLEQAMAVHGNDHLVIYGYSQGAVIANREKKELAKQYPAGTEAPDIYFVLSGDLNVPNGGLLARFPGLYIPILDWSFNGPEPTDTKFDTVVITRQYDGFADFPLYPLNVIADVNAVLGFLYVHDYNFDVSLAPDSAKSPTVQNTHGDTSYYFFDTPDLPLFGPLRSLGVPEPVIDVVEPFFRDIVELGYDRSIKPWEPTPARLIPTLDPATVAGDLLDAIAEGINNARSLIDPPAPLGVRRAPAGDTAQLDISQQTTYKDTASKTDQTSTDMPTSKKHDTATAKQELAPEPTAVNARKHSASASQSESAKPSTRSITPRPVARGSLKVLEKSRDLPHRQNGAEPTTHPASGDTAATTRSNSSGDNSSGGDSSGGDAGES